MPRKTRRATRPMASADDLCIRHFYDVLGDVMAHGQYALRLHGGRESTKLSFILVAIVLLLLARPEANAVVRQFSNTLCDSLFSQMTWAIAIWDWSGGSGSAPRRWG